MLSLLLRWEKALQSWDFLSSRSLCAMSFSLVPIPLPSPREIHFWYVMPAEVKNSCLLNQYLDLLSPPERDGVLRMDGDNLQKGALLARALVRTTISRYTDCRISATSLKFKKNQFGKPEVDWDEGENWALPALHFNISHSHSMVACGVTTNSAIGVDVEEKHRQLRNNILSFARRYFTPQEVSSLHALSDPEIQRQELIKLWTLKEAYVKALGRGFSAAPFRDFLIQLQPFNDVINHMSEITVKPSTNSEFLTTNWEFALFELAHSHYAAICREKEDNIKGLIMFLIDRSFEVIYLFFTSSSFFPLKASGDSEEEKPLRVKVWKTVPFVEDVLVSGTDEVEPISGFF